MERHLGLGRIVSRRGCSAKGRGITTVCRGKAHCTNSLLSVHTEGKPGFASHLLQLDILRLG